MQRKTVSGGIYSNTQCMRQQGPVFILSQLPITCAAAFQVSGLEAFASQDQILILAIIKASDLKMLPKYNVTNYSVRRLSLSDNLSVSNQVNVCLLSIYLGFPWKAMTQSLYSLSCLGDSHLKTHVIVRKISFAPNPGDSAVSYVPPQ